MRWPEGRTQDVVASLEERDQHWPAMSAAAISAHRKYFETDMTFHHLIESDSQISNAATTGDWSCVPVCPIGNLLDRGLPFREARDKRRSAPRLTARESKCTQPAEEKVLFPPQAPNLGQCRAEELVPQELEEVPTPIGPVEAEAVPYEVEAAEQ
jgi:hypothetical protein